MAVDSVLLAQDTWTGSTGAAWAGQWTTMAGTQTIQANAGRVTAATSNAFDKGRADLTGMTGSGTFDLSFTLLSTAGSQVNQFAAVSIASSNDIVGGDASNGWYPHTGYAVELQYSTTAAASTLGMYSLDAGPQTLLGTAVTVTATFSTRYSLRVQKLGTTLRAKLWTSGATEPDTWTNTQTVTNTYSGIVGLTVGNGAVTAARSFDFDDLLVYNGIAQATSATCGGQTARRTISW
jgi:hypothetical protein